MISEEDHGVNQQFNWFWYFINSAKESHLFNDSSFHAAIGKRRSGKTVLCLGAACAVDPDITSENICFGLDELKAQLNEKTDTSIIWEEAGASAYSRDFMNERNKLIVKTLQVYGYKKISIFGNFQHLKYLDGDIRLQLDAFFKMKANHQLIDKTPITHTYALPFAVVTDYINEPLIAPYKVTKEGVYQAIGGIPIPQMDEFFKMCNVTKGFYKDYLRKKDEYFIELGEEDKEEAPEIFSKRELKTITRMNTAFLDLVVKLIEEDKKSKALIAKYADIPVSTLNVWLSKAEEIHSFESRVLPEETTTKTFFPSN